MHKPLVLLPGLLCDARLWRGEVAGLADTMAPLVADLTLDDSIPAMARRVLAVEPPRFALAGLSMGGYVALEIMRQAPERVTHLALFDTTARADDAARRQLRLKAMEMTERGKFVGVSRGLLKTLLAPQHLGTDMARMVQAMALDAGPEVYLRQQTAILGRIDSLDMLGTIAVPTLVGVGEADQMTPPERAEEMAAAIAGARLVRFPESGHLPTVENPAAVTAAMRAWLDR